MLSQFSDLGFDKHIEAINRISISSYFGKSNRTGIYILHFSDNEYYVGMAIDVVKRFSQHRKTYHNIVSLDFKKVSIGSLKEEERIVVESLEKIVTLKNIAIVNHPKGPSDLDNVILPKKQAEWLKKGLPFSTLIIGRKDYPEWRMKYSTKFQRLKQLGYYKRIVDFLGYYLSYSIPFPRKTEYSFWSCSCLPGKNTFTRLNINWQEVMNVRENEFRDMGNGQIFNDLEVTFYLSKELLFSVYTKSQLKQKFHSIDFGDHIYKPGGNDQQQVFLHIDDAFLFLDDEHTLSAIKDFNLRLMRRKGAVSNRYHCFDLADAALVKVKEAVRHIQDHYK